MFLEPELNELERPNRGAIGLLSDDGDGDTADAGFAAPAVGDASESDELDWRGALGLRSDAKRRADDEDDEELDDDVDDEDELEEEDEEFDDDTDDDFDDDELDEEDDDELEEFDDEDDDV